MPDRNQLLESIALLWPELPDLIGDDWPQFSQRCATLTELLHAEPAQAPIIEAELADLFKDSPAFDRLLETLNDLSGHPEVAMDWRGLAGDPQQPKPKLKLVCAGEGGDPPHPLTSNQVDFSDPDRIACRDHPDAEVSYTE